MQLSQIQGGSNDAKQKFSLSQITAMKHNLHQQLQK